MDTLLLDIIRQVVRTPRLTIVRLTRITHTPHRGLTQHLITHQDIHIQHPEAVTRIRLQPIHTQHQEVPIHIRRQVVVTLIRLLGVVTPHQVMELHPMPIRLQAVIIRLVVVMVIPLQDRLIPIRHQVHITIPHQRILTPTQHLEPII